VADASVFLGGDGLLPFPAGPPKSSRSPPTTSTQDKRPAGRSGADVREAVGIKVKVVAVGTGQALSWGSG